MKEASVQLYPYLFQPEAGAPLAAEWGQLTVPENRRSSDSRLISVPFVRFRGGRRNTGTAAVFLQGGPGTSAISYLPLIWNTPVMRPPVELVDSIFVEHRGYERSRPNLDCPGSYDVALDEPGSAGLYAAAHRRYLERAIPFWQEQGIDLAGYNAREMAADIDDLRRALGYEKLIIYGGSFGSHHALALLRCCGRFVERAFLWSVEGPNHTIKLPGNIQKQLQRLNRYVKEDAALNGRVPDLLELMAGVLERLEKPVTTAAVHPQTREETAITVGAYDLQRVTADGLYGTPFLSALPLRYLAMEKGDYSWLAAQTMRLRVNQRSNLMEEATDIASGATAERRQQIAAEAPLMLLGDAINDSFFGMEDLSGPIDLGDDFRGRLVSDVPVVLVGGTLDARTPVSNAEELLPDLAQGALVTVAGASHDIVIRGAHILELAAIRDRFFRGEDPSASELDAAFSLSSEI